MLRGHVLIEQYCTSNILGNTSNVQSMGLTNSWFLKYYIFRIYDFDFRIASNKRPVVIIVFVDKYQISNSEYVVLNIWLSLSS